MATPYKKVTRKDVAELAGVSETVVSYVINNNRYVDKVKREKVEQAIRKLHYRPNNIARALKGKSTNHIVFIADQIVTEHFSLLVRELDQNAYDRGYMISLCENRNTEKFVSEIISRQYDGIIISSISFPNKFVQEFISANIPVVLLQNRDYSNVKGAGIIDNGLYEGAKECVRFLQERNRKNILYIDRFSTHNHFSDMNDLRYRGFVEQMRESGLSQEPEKQVITGCTTGQEVAQKVKEYIRSGHKVDAIFGRNDKMACIAMHAVQDMGLRVPEDVAVLGFDNSTLGQYVTPSITSMSICRQDIAKAAVEMLQQMIGGGETPEPVYIPTEMICRESTPTIETSSEMPDRR